MQYEVTIGIPVYRAVDYIKQTIESALCQTYSSIEYLILDDCGGDGSIQIVKEMQLEHPRGHDIRIVSHEENHGVGVARNRIISEARGRYLYFLDSDDIIEPDTIDRFVSVIQKYDADVVYGSWKRIDKVKNSPSMDFVYPYKELLTPDSLALYAFKNYSSFRISVCNCLMNISFLRTEQLKFIDTMFWEDLVFTYEMVTKVRRAILLPDITYHYLCRPGSLSHYQDRDALQKKEILNNAQTINYLKDQCRSIVKKPYLPFLCYNLEMNSFYIVCHILKQKHRIVPEITSVDMHKILRYPSALKNIICFRQKLLQNIFFWQVSYMPPSVSLSIVWLLGKYKKVI